MQRIEHNDIIKLMQALGYTPDDDNEGVCHGIAMMGLQACTIGDIDSFNKRLDFIKQTPDLTAKIANVKAKLAAKSLDTEVPKRLILSDEEQKIIDVIAFLEGVEIHQNPRLYARYFEKTLSQGDGVSIVKITASESLEAIGGIHKLKAWLGIYNEEEFERYFVILQKIANQIRQSFSMSLSSCSHTIALHYNAAKATFYVVDANSLPITSLPTEMTLAQWVKKALMAWSDVIAFETRVYTSGNTIDCTKQFITAIGNEQDFVNLHAITAVRASYVDCYQCNLAIIASENGYVDVVRALHAVGANLNVAIPDGATPAFVAAQCGQADIIQVLHKAGANLNTARLDGATPALIAACHGHVNVLQVLWEARVDLTLSTPFGTPLVAARLQGHQACITFLETFDKRVNRKRPSFFAVSPKTRPKRDTTSLHQATFPGI